MKSTTCGNGTSATKLGSNFDCFAASCSAVPLNGGLVFSHLSRSVTRAGVVAHTQHLRQQLIRIERDRGQQAVNLGRRYLLRRAGRFRL